MKFANPWAGGPDPSRDPYWARAFAWPSYSAHPPGIGRVWEEAAAALTEEEHELLRPRVGDLHLFTLDAVAAHEGGQIFRRGQVPKEHRGAPSRRLLHGAWLVLLP